MSNELSNINDMQNHIHINSDIGVCAALEAKRLSEKYGKDFFDCEDLVQIMGIGKNNVGRLLRSDTFPTMQIGNRKVVSAIAFALWLLTPEFGG